MVKQNKKNASVAAYPYFLWSILFIIVPILMVLYFSLTSEDGGFTFENYKRLLTPLYMKVFFKSIGLALVSTLLCLILGYPMAYIMSKLPLQKRSIYLMLFIIPMWMNFLLRTYAWMNILGKNGILNSLLQFLGFEPIQLLYNNGAVLLGMVYNFLPFMVIPIYTVLIKIDQDLVNAAKDLGGNSFIVFKKVILPLSLPGVISGITMVFMPAVSTFVISRLLGGGQYMLIGNLIEQQFTSSGDWYFGSAISIFMMILILISMGIMNKFDKDEDTKGGAHLW